MEKTEKRRTPSPPRRSNNAFSERHRSRSRERERDLNKRGDRRRSRSRSPPRRSRSRSPTRRFRRTPSPRRRRPSHSPPRRSRRSRSHSRSPDRKGGDRDDDRQLDSVDMDVEGEDSNEVKTPNEEEEMAKLMGFSGFNTTKGKHVPGAANLEGSKLVKPHKYRQYMNRRGGFNRPLDYVA